jgi:phage replication O-like protein O
MNPQAENGHTDISNEVIDFLCHYRLSGEEWQVLLVILRKTWGWHKKNDLIPLSQFSTLTKLPRPTVCRAINKLLSKKIIGVDKKDNSGVSNYWFNKDCNEWVVLSKKITVLSKKIMTVDKKDNEVLSKKTHSKENTKETNQKKKGFILFLDFEKLLNEKLQNEKIKEALVAYFDMREAKKIQMTEYAAKLQINKLLKWAESKIPINKILDSINNSIVSNWTNIYKPKEEEK